LLKASNEETMQKTLGIDGVDSVKRILKKLGGRMGVGLIWPRKETGGTLL
jgi:hypothetical protein